MSKLSTRLLLRRKELGLSQEELAQRMGYRSKSSITKLEKGVNDLPQAKLEELAAALETTPAYLLGLDAPCTPPPGFEPLPKMVRVPLIGSIACGTPITAEQNIECYIGVPAAWHADFALTCHGDSMSPTIWDVYKRQLRGSWATRSRRCRPRSHSWKPSWAHRCLTAWARPCA